MKRSAMLTTFKVFGCFAHAHVPDELRKKLDPKSEACMLLAIMRT